MSTKNKELTFESIKKGAEAKFEQETYELADGREILFFVTFPHTMVNELLDTFQKSIQSKDEGIEIENEDLFVQFFVQYHIVRKFTHLSDTFTATTFAGQFEEMKALINEEVLGESLMEVLFDEVFLKDQVRKVFNKFSKALSNMAFLEKYTKQVTEEISKLELQNKDLLKQFNPKSVVQ